MPLAQRKRIPSAAPNDGLSVFDEFDGLVLTGLTFKSAFLDPRLVRLDAREPHRRAAFGAGRMNDVL
jgi:hypothetical protein